MSKKRSKSWDTLINQAEKRGYFTDLDIAESGDWATCAVGEKRSSRSLVIDAGFDEGTTIELTKTGGDEYAITSLDLPKETRDLWLAINHYGPSSSYDNKADDRLFDAGMDFTYAVQNNKFGAARRARARIAKLWAKASKLAKAKTVADRRNA